MSMHPAVSNGAYDVERIRADFPALAMQVYGKPLVYLDNAASAQKPKAVLDRMQQAYTTEYANVHRGLHYLANAATEAYEGAREKVRAFLNAARRKRSSSPATPPRRSTSSPIRFGRERIKAGDEIVLSIMEHHSNIVPWHFLRERQGAVIKWAPVDDDGNFLIDEFEKLLDAAHQDGRDHADVERARHRGAGEGSVVKLAHARGIPVLVDGSQAAVHLRRRRAGHRLRLLRHHRPQAVRPDRHRRAVWQIRASRADAAVQRRRRDDPRRVRGSRHLWRSAAQVRGRHAADRAGDRAGRGASITSIRSARSASARTRTTLVDLRA